jgi:hypothetical protein
MASPESACGLNRIVEGSKPESRSRPVHALGFGFGI